jgi:hypothetical protein
MAKKQLRTVKKSSQTGRLSRAEVRSAVITVRDGRTGRFVDNGKGDQYKSPGKGAGTRTTTRS